MLNCPRQYAENVAWRDCNFSNMEQKLSKYVWSQQLTGFSASYLEYCNAKSHTTANDSYRLVEHVTFYLAGDLSA